MDKHIQCHRFGDSLALYVGSGETVYLSIDDARAFTRALNKVNRSIEREPFVNSPPLTFERNCKDGRYHSKRDKAARDQHNALLRACKDQSNV